MKTFLPHHGLSSDSRSTLHLLASWPWVRFTLERSRESGISCPARYLELKTAPVTSLRVILTSVSPASTGRASVNRLVKRSACAAARRLGLCESSRLLLSLRSHATTAPDENRGRPRADDCNLRPRHDESDDRPPPCFVENRGHRASAASCARRRTGGDHARPVTNDGLHPVRSGGEKSSATVDANCAVRTMAAATWMAGGKKTRNRGNVAAYEVSLRQ